LAIRLAVVCSIVIRDVDEMPSVVQNQLLDLLAELELARPPSAAVRLVCGTTVSLLDGIAAGTFSERLFYRFEHHPISSAVPPVPGRRSPDEPY
jgi:DNA-binding NtrC family response regulator